MITVYLYTPTNLLGWIICIATQCKYSHAAIKVDGIVWDSSESRGDFDAASRKTIMREHTAFDLKGDLTDWVSSMRGKKYDWKGVIGWFFDWDSKNRFYCFEAVHSALVELKIAEATDDAISGDTIYEILNDRVVA